MVEPQWFSEAWLEVGAHWHAYAAIGDPDEPGAVPPLRVQRLELAPDAVLRSPDEVGDYVAGWVASREDRPYVYAPGERVWVQVGDEADMERIRGEYALIAARGDSAYVHLALGGERKALYLEAVTNDHCNGHHDDRPGGDGHRDDPSGDESAASAGAGDS